MRGFAFMVFTSRRQSLHPAREQEEEEEEISSAFANGNSVYKEGINRENESDRVSEEKKPKGKEEKKR